jgi:hypothetical protein
MAIAEMCPNCGKEVKAPDYLAGKRIKCLKCQTFFTLNRASPAGDEPPMPTAPRSSVEQPDDERPVRGAVRAAFVLGLASILLGLSAGMLGLFPATVEYCRIVAWLGIALGGGAIILAILREECGFGFPFTGTITSLLALALIVFWLDAARLPDTGMGPPDRLRDPKSKGPPDWKGEPPFDW